MKVIQTQLADQLTALLEESSVLVNLYATEDAGFTRKLLEWLQKGEAVLTQHHKPQVSVLAGIRACTVAAGRGVYDKNRFVIERGQSRKVIAAITAIAFNQAQDILQDILQQAFNLIEKAEGIVKQVLLVAYQKQLLQPILQGPGTISQKLNAIWAMLLLNAELDLGAKQILSHVSYPDALRLIETVLEGWY
jgi:phospholipase/lecithinase/hemolysin